MKLWAIAATLAAWTGGSAAVFSWSVTILDSPPAGSLPNITTKALAVTATHQFGWSFGIAASWEGTATSRRLMNPAEADQSHIDCAYGGFQGGDARFLDHDHAGVWHGNPLSFIDLDPGDCFSSYVTGIAAEGQVGYVVKVNPFATRAYLWRGSAGNFVDLTPDLDCDAVCAGAADGIQVGSFTLRKTLHSHACYWRSSASTMVDLTPDSVSFAGCHGASQGVQVGFVSPGISLHNRACLWKGTPESRLDLNPPKAHDSDCLAIDGPYQVGWALFVDPQPNGAYKFEHAGIWAGTARSFLDLHQLLPKARRYRSSEVGSPGTELEFAL